MAMVDQQRLGKGKFCSISCARKGKPSVALSRIDQSAGADGCWPWTGYRNRDGYGVSARRRGMRQLAHRFSYEHFIGPIPPGMVVLHRCDNPPCCNPEHLMLGTQTDNVADMIAKRRGKYRSGATHPRAVLTEVMAIEIKRRLAAGEAHRSVAADFGVHPSTIFNIALGKTWAHAQ